MKSFTISVVVLACVGGVLGSDMRIDFPLFMRAPAPAAASAAAGTATNLQTFTGALGGIAADPVCSPLLPPCKEQEETKKRDDTNRSKITQTGNAKTPFAVDGDTFTDFATAAMRSCNNQHNSCAQAANNSGDKTLTVGQCDTQQTACEAAAASASPAVSSTTTSSAEPTLKSEDADFFYFCDP
ncbi:hypothetical protein V8E51_007489 [Hyaloscypha variabilis]